VQKAVGIVDWDFDSDSRFAGDDQIVQVMIVIDVLDDVKGVGVPETVQELAAFAAAIDVVHDGVDLADVGVNAKPRRNICNSGMVSEKNKVPASRRTCSASL